MATYQEQILKEVFIWQQKMQKKPSLLNKLARRLQNKLNSWIPEKVHKAITFAIEKMVKAAIFGIKYSTNIKLPPDAPLVLRESHIKTEIVFYQKTASIEGAVTGAGGILMGFADFPLLIGIKMKLLFNIASLYGYNVKDYKERLYLLYIFQLAYSSQQRRNEVYKILANWPAYSQNLPNNAEEFDWRLFQQEYRDYIDIAKMAQLLPVVGAAVGAVANYKLVAQLGYTAMNCFRMRLHDTTNLLET